MDEVSRLRTMFSRIGAMFRRKKLDRELEDELRAHLEMAAEENRRRGMNTEEARRKAMRDFGGVTQVRETVRMREGVPFVENLRRDGLYALRQMRKSPGFRSGGDHHAGAGDWGEHDGVQHCGCGDAAAAALTRSRSGWWMWSRGK